MPADFCSSATRRRIEAEGIFGAETTSFASPFARAASITSPRIAAFVALTECSSMISPGCRYFVTRSSAATLPVSFRAMDEAGVPRAISSFSLPLGATVNMDGVCVHLPVFAILAANMFGLELTAVQLLTLVVSVMFASVGAGGVPGGSVFLLFMVLDNMGLAPDQTAMIVALALGINPILDMFETCCNVTGDNVCTYVVGAPKANPK